MEKIENYSVKLGLNQHPSSNLDQKKDYTELVYLAWQYFGGVIIGSLFILKEVRP